MSHLAIASRFAAPGLLVAVVTVAPACDSVASGPDACVPVWTNVLVNPGFDDGHVTWVEEPVEPPSVCGASQVPFAVDSPEFAACLGTGNDRTQTLTQLVDLPSSFTQVRLRGVRCLVTEDSATDVKDTLEVELRDGETFATIAELGGFSNKDGRATCDWTTFELQSSVAETPRRGQLWIRAETDDANVTSFYLDTLQLEVLACP
jgi:hypothetical protein